MPATRIRHTDWTAGEFDPRLEGRVDQDRFFRSARQLENVIIAPSGGVRRRPGTRYVATTKTDGDRVRLLPFIFSRSQAYILEIGDQYIRFYANTAPLLDGVTPVEVAIDHAVADLAGIKTEQSADVLYLFHGDYPTAVLERLAAAVFRYRTSSVFTVPASIEYGARPAQTLTPGATTGAGITFTANAAYFYTADIGREIIVTAGASHGARATITAVGAGAPDAACTATITQDFDSTDPIASGSWKLSDSPQTSITIGDKVPVGKTGVTLVLTDNGWRAEDVGKFVIANGGCYEITTVSDAKNAAGTIRGEATATTIVYAPQWTLEEAAWSSSNGYPVCGLFHEDRLWLGVGTRLFGSKTGDYGNFAAGVLDDDGIVYPLNTREINAIRALSSINRGLIVHTAGADYVLTSGDNTVLTPSNVTVKSATTYGIAENVPPLRVSNAVLFPTPSSRRLRQFVYAFDTDSYSAPDLMLLARHLTDPKRINRVRVNRRLVEVAYQREPDGLVWAVREDGTLLSMTYLPEQNVVGWARSGLTGTLLTDPDGRRYPAVGDGRVESIAVIPHPDGDRDQVWLSVARTIGSTVKRFIEVLDDGGQVYDDLCLDAAVTYDGTGTVTLTPGATSGTGVAFTAGSAVFVTADIGKELRLFGTSARATITALGGSSPHAVAVATIPAGYEWPSTAAIAAGAWGLAAFIYTGLGHLEGEEVAVIGDGAIYPRKTVTSGAVTVDFAAVRTEIGLAYTALLETQRPEITQLGSTQGRQQKVGPVTLRFRDTLGAVVKGQTVPFRVGGDTMGAPPPLFSGDKEVPTMGWDRVGRLTITQEDPLPFEVLLLTAVLNVAD